MLLGREQGHRPGQGLDAQATGRRRIATGIRATCTGEVSACCKAARVACSSASRSNAARSRRARAITLRTCPASALQVPVGVAGAPAGPPPAPSTNARPIRHPPIALPPPRSCRAAPWPADSARQSSEGRPSASLHAPPRPAAARSAARPGAIRPPAPLGHPRIRPQALRLDAPQDAYDQAIEDCCEC